MTPRRRKALLAACIVLAFATCALLIGTHRQASAFHTQFTIKAQPVLRSRTSASPWPQGTVDVNTATIEELCSLQGIGPSLASAIIAQRETDGAFDYPEDLLTVKGIGQKTLQKFWDQLNFTLQASQAP